MYFPFAANLKGTLKKDKKTKRLIHRLKRGDVALIDHKDLDDVSAADLIEHRPCAVVNVAKSLSGELCCKGVFKLLDASVPVFECDHQDLFDMVSEGDVVEIRDDVLTKDGHKLCVLERLERSNLLKRLDVAESGKMKLMEEFVRNTVCHMQKETGLASQDAVRLDLKAKIAGRPCAVVARGSGYRRDLKAVHSFLENEDVVILAVDGAADTLIDAGLVPEVIIGDMDSVSDQALRCGAELVAHVYDEQRSCIQGSYAPTRLEALGLKYKTFCITGTSEDAALILAHDMGASQVIGVGLHFSMMDFVEKNRMGMSSTVLTRMRVGDNLIDARGFSNLTSSPHEGIYRGCIFAFMLIGSAVMLTYMGASTLFLNFLYMSPQFVLSAM